MGRFPALLHTACRREHLYRFVLDRFDPGECLARVVAVAIAPAAAAAPDVGEQALAALERIRLGAISADELARALGIGAGELAVLLTELELAGTIQEEDGVYRASR